MVRLEPAQEKLANDYIRRAQAIVKKVKGLMQLSGWEFFIEPRPAAYMRPGTVATINYNAGSKRAHILVNVEFDFDAAPMLGSFEEVIIHELMHAVIGDTGIPAFGELLDEEQAEAFEEAIDAHCDRMARILMEALSD